MNCNSTRFACPECYELRIATPSGAVCPNGHGRLQAGVTAEQLKRVEHERKVNAWLAGLPHAERIFSSRSYNVEGVPGVWRIIAFDSSKVSYGASRRVPDFTEQQADADCRIVWLGDKVRMLRKMPATKGATIDAGR